MFFAKLYTEKVDEPVDNLPANRNKSLIPRGFAASHYRKACSIRRWRFAAWLTKLSPPVIADSDPAIWVSPRQPSRQSGIAAITRLIGWQLLGKLGPYKRPCSRAAIVGHAQPLSTIRRTRRRLDALRSEGGRLAREQKEGRAAAQSTGGARMSRSRKKTPIFGHTGSISEAADKAAWHRRHRANERVGRYKFHFWTGSTFTSSDGRRRSSRAAARQ